MKKRTKIITSIFVIAIAIFGVIFYQTFYASHRNIATEKPELSIVAKQLQNGYAENFEKANALYADKVIEVKGSLTAIETSSIVLNDAVQVDFLSNITLDIKVGENMTVKGRCVGYDDLLELVRLDQAIILTNK